MAKTIHEVALEVIEGKWGNGDERINRLGAAGYVPWTVQQEVNRILGNPSSAKPAAATRTDAEITAAAYDVIAGKYGVGEDRVYRLAQAGFVPWDVQKKVNEILARGM